MVKVLVAYYSRSGHTGKMAAFIARGARSAGGRVSLKRIEAVSLDDLKAADAVVIGSPTYYGGMAAPVKELLDRSVALHKELEGRVGGAFASSAHVGGGNETTVLAILEALIIHGMVVQGDPRSDHYGPVSVGAPDGRVEAECLRYGKRVTELAGRLRSVSGGSVRSSRGRGVNRRRSAGR